MNVLWYLLKDCSKVIYNSYTTRTCVPPLCFSFTTLFICDHPNHLCLVFRLLKKRYSKQLTLLKETILGYLLLTFELQSMYMMHCKIDKYQKLSGRKCPNTDILTLFILSGRSDGTKLWLFKAGSFVAQSDPPVWHVVMDVNSCILARVSWNNCKVSDWPGVDTYWVSWRLPVVRSLLMDLKQKQQWPKVMKELKF